MSPAIQLPLSWDEANSLRRILTWSIVYGLAAEDAGGFEVQCRNGEVDRINGMGRRLTAAIIETTDQAATADAPPPAQRRRRTAAGSTTRVSLPPDIIGKCYRLRGEVGPLLVKHLLARGLKEVPAVVLWRLDKSQRLISGNKLANLIESEVPRAEWMAMVGPEFPKPHSMILLNLVAGREFDFNSHYRSPGYLKFALGDLLHRGFVTRTDDGKIVLTEEGEKQAKALVAANELKEAIRKQQRGQAMEGRDK